MTGTPHARGDNPALARLVDAVRDGDQQAFAELYDRLSPLVFGAVRRIVRDGAMAEDVTQEVFVEIWTTVRRFDATRGSVTSWATTIARRRAVDRVRREESQRQRLQAVAARRADEVPLPSDTVVDTIEAQRVRRALHLLPPDQRQVLSLAFLDGHSHSTIAEDLGIPLGTAKGRVRIGLQRLANALKEER